MFPKALKPIHTKKLVGATVLKDQMSYYVSHLPSPGLIPFPDCILNPVCCGERAVAMAEGVVRKTQGVYQGQLQSWGPGNACGVAIVGRRVGKRMGLVLKLHPSALTLFFLRLLVTGS